jgi:hypothetical protein
LQFREWHVYTATDVSQLRVSKQKTRQYTVQEGNRTEYRKAMFNPLITIFLREGGEHINCVNKAWKNVYFLDITEYVYNL